MVDYGDLIPIDTAYDGYLFRSRLEARWATFFNHMGWNYLYEREGFKLECGYYLPDFYFPEIKVWGEVKADILTAEEYEKCRELSQKMNSNLIGIDVLLLEGQPKCKTYRSIINGNLGENVILIGKDEKHYPFYTDEVFNYKNWFFDQTKKAVIKAGEARFEREWKERNHG